VTSYVVPFQSYCSLLFKFVTLWGFESPFGGSGTTYDVHLGLIGKRVVDLLVLIELFSLGVMAESLRAKRDRKSTISLQRGHFDPKFQVERVAPNNRSSQKTRLNVLSQGIKTWTDLSSVLSQITRLTVGRTDRGT